MYGHFRIGKRVVDINIYRENIFAPVYNSACFKEPCGGQKCITGMEIS